MTMPNQEFELFESLKRLIDTNPGNYLNISKLRLLADREEARQAENQGMGRHRGHPFTWTYGNSVICCCGEVLGCFTVAIIGPPTPADRAQWAAGEAFADGLSKHGWKDLSHAMRNAVSAAVEAYVHASSRPCSCANRLEISCPVHGKHLCPNCGHEIKFHSDDGCWHTVTSGRLGANSVCPCALSWQQARDLSHAERSRNS